MGDMKSYRVELKVKNNYLYRVMKLHGYENPSQLAKAAGITYPSLIYAMNLAKPAYTSNGKLSAVAEQLCDFFSCSVDEIYPMEHLHEKLEINSGAIEANKEELLPVGLLEQTNDPILAIENKEKETLSLAALEELTPREKGVIKMRFGFEDEPKTLREIGEIYGLQQERIRQIEAKALRKLRNPDVSKTLREFVDA